MTNVRNRQTCTVGDLNIVPPTVALVAVKALEVVGEVIRSPGVHQPGRSGVGVRGSSVDEALVVVVVGAEVVVVAVATVGGKVPPIAANLAAWALLLATGVLPGVLVAIATIVAATVAATGLLAVITAVVRPVLPLLVDRKSVV